MSHQQNVWNNRRRRFTEGVRMKRDEAHNSPYEAQIYVDGKKVSLGVFEKERYAAMPSTLRPRTFTAIMRVSIFPMQYTANPLYFLRTSCFKKVVELLELKCLVAPGGFEPPTKGL